MIVRRWSEWVVAAYVEDPGNPFGDRLLYVADRRESVAMPSVSAGFAPVFGYDRDTTKSGRAGAQTPVIPGLAPTEPERPPMMQHTPDGCT